MDRTRFIVAGSFIDGSGAKVCRNVYLAVNDSIITGIGPAADLPRNDWTAVDDLSYCTIVPSLVDCSVSLSKSPSVDEKVRLAAEEAGPAQKAALVAQYIRYFYSHGVLGVAAGDDNSSPGEHVQKLVDQGINIDIRTTGSDFLKIVYTESIDNGKAPNSFLNREDLGRILQQKGKKKAVVVANGEQRVQEALAAGCDAIEQGYGMGEENLRKMADMDVLWVPSVLMAKNAMLGSSSGGDVMCRFSMRYVAPGKGDPDAETFWKKMLAEQLTQLRLARKLGVKTAVGTGAGNVGILHGESMVEEMKLFLKAGYSLEETIRCASDNGARFFGMEDLGALAIGRKATFLVARGTVQQLPRKLAYLEGIYVDGSRSKTF
ncbi:MAG: amidohydrolase family protein [Planctomycetota bacterium]|jgi:imidazolonepropionase-like amidohydrolase